MVLISLIIVDNVVCRLWDIRHKLDRFYFHPRKLMNGFEFT